MTAEGAVAALRVRLARRGLGDIEANMTGGYDPTTTPADAGIVRAILGPRLAGSWPGFVFTGDPPRLPAGHFGLGHGNGAHAPNEYYVIESGNAKIQGIIGRRARTRSICTSWRRCEGWRRYCGLILNTTPVPCFPPR
jgi:hypothetical protein